MILVVFNHYTSVIKKIILVSVGILFYGSSFSQYRGGVEAGINIMNADFNLIGYSTLDIEPTYGFRLGYTAEHSLFDHFYLKFGALLNQRGFKWKWTDNRERLIAVDLPINLGYSRRVVYNGMRPFVDAGVNLGINVHATNDELDAIDHKFSIGTGPKDIERFSFGVNVGAGLVIFEDLKIRFSYYKGLTDLARYNGLEWKNQTFGFAIHYLFTVLD